jgi:hypothetical protein
MKLFKIVDSRNKVSYTSSFDFATAIADFSTAENEKDRESRKKIVSIKELPDYNGTPAFKRILVAFGEIERDFKHSGIPAEAVPTVSRLVAQFRELAEKCLGE